MTVEAMSPILVIFPFKKIQYPRIFLSSEMLFAMYILIKTQDAAYVIVSIIIEYLYSIIYTLYIIIYTIIEGIEYAMYNNASKNKPLLGRNNNLR